MANQPNSYKKFVATAATAALVASALIPAASAAETKSFKDVSTNYKEAVDYLVANEITEGFSDTIFGTDSPIKRGDAAIFIANALGLDTVNAPSADFTDVNSRVKGAVNAIVNAKIATGKSESTFAPDDNITRAEMAKLLVNAYKLKAGDTKNKFTDVNSTWDGYVDALLESGVTLGLSETTFGATQDVTRGQFALFIHRAEGSPVADTDTLVTAVKAVDAKTIAITFNNAVDAKTLKNAAKADVIVVAAAENASNPGEVKQTLSADGKTLTLTATTFFKGDYTVKVPFEIVKDTKGKFVKAVNQKVTVNDTAAPVLESAQATVADTKNNIKSITLTFNEDVKTIDTVKINGVNHSPAIDGKTATVSVDLDATKSYDVTVVNATDAVDNIKDVQAVKLALSVDNLAPSITNVVPTGENTVTVTLDKALKDDSLVLTAKVGAFVTNIATEVIVNPKNKKEYFVTLNSSYLFKNGNSDTVTLTAAKEALVDALGNKNSAEITKSVSVSKDATAPTVSKVETTTTNGKVTGFTATLSEKVQNLDASKVSVVNSKGEILATSAVVASTSINNEDATKVNFTFAADLKADKYSFELAKGLVKDLSLAKNDNVTHSFTVDTSNGTAPVETAYTIASTTTPGTNVLTVDFGTKVKATGTGSALNPASYQVNGNVLPANTEITFAGSTGEATYQTKVNIKLPAGFVSANDDKAIFRVIGVQSLDSKVNNAYTALVPVYDNAAPEAKSFVATDLTKLVVTYSEAVEVVVGSTITDEIQLINGKGESVSIEAFAVTNGKLVLTVADATSVAKLSTIKVDAANADIKDAEGNVQKSAITLSK